jgi:alpha-D-ribose 1-methylphosphonate 5-triphosphate synthase subunit PhnG
MPLSRSKGSPDTMLCDTQSSHERKAALALLARANFAELAEPLARNWPDLAVRDLKKPEIGLAMVRGRMGGDGAAFNLGEATVTRAVVELAGGARGYGQMLGRKPVPARLAAIADALWQQEAERPLVERDILAPIRHRLAREKATAAGETAATRVDFFTLVRGDA